MKPYKNDIRRWVNSLRSGSYKQTQAALQDEIGFCCLGVACEIFSPNHPRDYLGHLVAGTPEIYLRDPSWLAKIDTDFAARTGTSLMHLNDDKHFTFDEIADLLQAVYIHEVFGPAAVT